MPEINLGRINSSGALSGEGLGFKQGFFNDINQESHIFIKDDLENIKKEGNL